MADNLQHKDCKGKVYLNLTPIFRIVTPSISFTEKGISVGVVELQSAGSRATGAVFSCSKCNENITMKDAGKWIEVQCSICKEYKPASEVNSSRQITSVCDTCMEFLSGEKRNPPESIQRILNYFDLKSSGISFIRYSDSFKKPLLF